MLNRIFWFTSASALVAVWLLRMFISDLETLLVRIDYTLEFGDKIVPIYGGYLFPAVAVGLASRVFRIHGLIAGWLGIRERFDIDVIIAELAARTGVDIHAVPDEELAHHRHELMRNGFYQFVSGREPQIDEHLIQRALDLWSWFWIGVEATAVFVVAGLVLIAAGVGQTGFTVVLAALAFAAIGLPAIRNECRRYAIAQVRAIVADPRRAEQVRQAFAGIALHSSIERRAA
jgi:hypothetical protein